MVRDIASLAGLYFVCSEYGPAAGRVMGKLSSETVSVLVESDAEPWQAFVTLSKLLEWSLFETRSGAVSGLDRLMEQSTTCYEITSPKP